MLRFEIKPPDFTAVQRQLAHIPGAAEKAMSRAINKAITTAKTEAIRGAKERYTIQSDALKTGIRVVLSSPRRLSATLLATSSFQRIAKFKVKLTGRLVTSEIIRGRNKVWPHSFLASVHGPHGGTHYGLFAREKEFSVPAGGRYAREKKRAATRGTDHNIMSMRLKRQKIVEAVTVSNPQMLAYYETMEQTMVLAEERLKEELDRQIELFLSGKVN